MGGRTLAIVGGGQLAALLVAEAQRHGTHCRVLDPQPNCPAAQQGAETIVGGFHDRRALHRLAAGADVVTVDLEDVGVETLAELEAGGMRVLPRPATLRRLTNKLVQKQGLQAAGLPTSPFRPLAAGDVEGLAAFGWPAVQKAASGGYDGRGVAIIDGPHAVDQMLATDGFVEAYVPHRMELSVMVARGLDGETSAFAPVEMVFHQGGNLLDYLLAPARVDAVVADAAEALACEAVRAVDGVGVFGVEMFLAEDGRLLINEMAPRTHNSGHYTLDACRTSQFAQQYRVLFGEPLGDPARQCAAVMFNLLGEAGYEGDTMVEGHEEIGELPGVRVYLYGKERCFPLRKMGHVTVTAARLEAALAVAMQARERIRVRGTTVIGEEQA